MSVKENYITCVRPEVEKYVRDFEPDLTSEEFEDAVEYVCDTLFPPLCDELVCDILDSWRADKNHG